MKTTSFLFTAIIAGYLFLGASLSAQVTIGGSNAPQSFSILELVSNNTRGLRLPQLSQSDRQNLETSPGFAAEITGKAQGLQIFNTDTRCVETWNGAKWISQCSSSSLLVTYELNEGTNHANNPAFLEDTDLPFALLPATKSGYEFAGWYTDGVFSAPMASIPAGTTGSLTLYAKWDAVIIDYPSGQGNTAWGSNKYVGAFWRDNETGERIIAGTNASAWSAEVVDPDDSGSWLTLALGRRENPTLYTANPDEAEDYQLAAGVKNISGTGNIVFRIGATGTNPNSVSSDYKYPDNSNGKAPRYAKVVVHTATHDTIFCRQGESADYVFERGVAYSGSSSYKLDRTNAVRFSPYNLTNDDLTDSETWRPTVIKDGSFVEYPTQVGAFFQWANTVAGHSRRAYNPVNPAGAVSDWNNTHPTTYWTSGISPYMGDTIETCPSGWRRPNDGATNAEVLSPAISASECRQSLWLNPQTGTGSNTNNSFWGYYADGFFDRRQIVSGVGSYGGASSAVSVANKNVAYRGRLFYNPYDSRSLFLPAAGYRNTSDGAFNYTGVVGIYSSSSANSTDIDWSLHFGVGTANQTYTYVCSNGFSVRCVRE